MGPAGILGSSGTCGPVYLAVPSPHLPPAHPPGQDTPGDSSSHQSRKTSLTGQFNLPPSGRPCASCCPQCPLTRGSLPFLYFWLHGYFWSQGHPAGIPMGLRALHLAVPWLIAGTGQVHRADVVLLWQEFRGRDSASCFWSLALRRWQG